MGFKFIHAADIHLDSPLRGLSAYENAPAEQLRNASREALKELVKDADYVIAQFAPVNANVINAMQKNQIIVRYGIGYDNVDCKAAAASGTPYRSQIASMASARSIIAWGASR